MRSWRVNGYNAITFMINRLEKAPAGVHDGIRKVSQAASALEATSPSPFAARELTDHV